MYIGISGSAGSFNYNPKDAEIEQKSTIPLLKCLPVFQWEKLERTYIGY